MRNHPIPTTRWTPLEHTQAQRRQNRVYYTCFMNGHTRVQRHSQKAICSYLRTYTLLEQGRALLQASPKAMRHGSPTFQSILHENFREIDITLLHFSESLFEI